MARIPDEELSALKRSTSLAALVRARGIELKKRGNDLVACCPFHNDDTASFVVTESKNVFHCFGCDAGGSVVDFLMMIEGVSFRHAVELLRTDPLATGPATTRKLSCPLTEGTQGKKLLTEVMNFYRETFIDCGEAQSYLDNRGVLAAADAFGVGVANRTLGLRLPFRNRKAGAELRMHLIEVGAYRGSGHEHMNGSIVIPFLDDTGDVVEMYGRKIVSGLRKGTATHLYLPGPHRGILNGKNLGSEVIVCEAPIDAMSFYAAGEQSVTSSFGAAGVTEELYALLKSKSVVRIAFDADDAGEKNAVALTARLVADGVEVHRIRFARGSDANDALVKSGSTALTRAVRNSEWQGGKASIVVSDASNALRVAAPVVVIPSDEPSLVAVLDASPNTKRSEVEPSSKAPNQEATKEAASKTSAIVVDEHKDEASVAFGPRIFRVRNLKKNTVFGAMKINLMVRANEDFYVDNLDLYSAKSREHFAKAMSIELGVTVQTAKKDLGRLLLLLDEFQDAIIEAGREPEDKKVEMSDAARLEALEFLEDPNLIKRIVDDFDRCGVVGEELNKITGYIAAVSRLLKKPLAIIVQSASAAGKSALMNAVLNFVPDEDKVAYSAMTGQSLFYMEGGNLKHKVLAIAEEEGAERASYALKILQSEGKLRIASTGKDPESGRHVTTDYEVEGPTAIFTTTTSIDVDEELLNRCLVLTVDENREQSQAIQRLQRDLAYFGEDGFGVERDAIETRHQNAQRLLEPIAVKNPFARQLTFPSHQTRTRRDNQKYLTLIAAIALLHQHQRDHKKGKHGPFIEVTLDDIALGNRIARHALTRSYEELSPQTSKLLRSMSSLAKERAIKDDVDDTEIRLTRKDIRDETGLSPTRLHAQLTRLVELEYVVSERRKTSRVIEYSVLSDPDNLDLFLVDVTTLRRPNSAEAHSNSTQIPPKFRPNSTPINGTNGAKVNGTRSQEFQDSESVEVISADAKRKPIVRRAQFEVGASS